MNPGLVVVGGGPAGHAAASAYRSHGGGGPVRLVSADQHPPYNRPPLSKDYLRGLSEAHELFLESASYYSDRDIELTLSERVTRLDPGRKIVATRIGEEIAYDACVLATGSLPAVLPVDGGDHRDVLRLRLLHEGTALRRRAEQAASAVVVGSGFIGCEAAASLAMRGLAVAMVSAEELPQLDRLGRDAATRIAGWLRAAGVELVCSAEVTAVSAGHEVRLADGSTYTGDLVLTAVGVEPQSQLARDAGLTMEQDRIVVDEHMHTGAPGLFAAGDVALAFNTGAGRRLLVEHWGEALTMGETAGTCAAGGDSSWSNAPGFWSEIGKHTLKYAAWGDGYDEARLVEHGDGGFTVWYGADDTCVGVLTHEADDDYDRGTVLVEQHAPLPG